MTRFKLVVAAFVLALAPSLPAQAQVTLDVTKITCEQFTLYKITDPRNIAIWLSGYYHGKRDSTTVDTQQLTANVKKITDYCIMKPQETVWNAVETIFGPLK
jgi:acid stress chaperone HdeB